ncbi:hypothetical protein F4809DRAFT_636998 [Biscogniauxia mediterranea]|nr:hypothetical protein F4809DRAFT_636998 [Biscogniauxia mediterranea]
MPLLPGFAAPPPPMPTRSSSSSALQPARPAEPGPSPTVPTYSTAQRARNSTVDSQNAGAQITAGRLFVALRGETFHGCSPTSALARRGEVLPTSPEMSLSEGSQ